MDKYIYGSDLIVKLLEKYNIDYISFNPGATFRGIHHSVLNNSRFKIIQCCHEEISVAIAHGYTKASGKLMLVLVHSNVGLQHASMAIFNAWCDRVPMLIIGGIGPMSIELRRPWIDWIHTSNNPAGIIRDFIKWYDIPYSIKSAIESLHRAIKYTLTPPNAPVFIGLDTSIMESVVDYNLHNKTSCLDCLLPSGFEASIYDIEYLISEINISSKILFIVDNINSNQKTSIQLTQICEFLGIPVLDIGNRYNFPTKHALYFERLTSTLSNDVDLIICFDVLDICGILKCNNIDIDGNIRIISITRATSLISSGSADYQELCYVDREIGASSTYVINALHEYYNPSKKKVSPSASQRLSLINNEKNKILSDNVKQLSLLEKASLMHPAVVVNTVWEVVKNIKFSIVNFGSAITGLWIRRIWSICEKEEYLGGSGGAGLGYGLGAAIGASLAFKETGRICIDFQSDGDFLFTPSALWTAANNNIPVLILIMNNNSYNNSLEHAKIIAANRNQNVYLDGTKLDNPPVNYCDLSESFGVKSFGKVISQQTLTEQLKKAIEYIEIYKKPALLDILLT